MTDRRRSHHYVLEYTHRIRPLHCAIQKYTENLLDELIINSSPEDGDKLVAAVNEGEDGLTIAQEAAVESDVGYSSAISCAKIRSQLLTAENQN